MVLALTSIPDIQEETLQRCREDDLKRRIYVMKKMIEVTFGMVMFSGNLLRRE